MGGFAAPDVPCVKGPIPYCLEEVSRQADASARLKQLADAIRSLAPNYRGLETAFDTHLVAHVYKDPGVRQGIAAHLKKHWFDDASPDAYFGKESVAAAYAEGVLQAIDLSLQAEPPAPISAWWLLDYPSLKMLTLAEADQGGRAAGARVTLLIQTPRPPGDAGKGKVILGDLCRAYVSEAPAGGGAAATREVPKAIG